MLIEMLIPNHHLKEKNLLPEKGNKYFPAVIIYLKGVHIHLKFTIFITRYSAQLVEHPLCTWEVVDSNPD